MFELVLCSVLFCLGYLVSAERRDASNRRVRVALRLSVYALMMWIFYWLQTRDHFNVELSAVLILALALLSGLIFYVEVRREAPLR